MSSASTVAPAILVAPSRKRFFIMVLLFITVVINYLDRSNGLFDQGARGGQYPLQLCPQAGTLQNRIAAAARRADPGGVITPA